MRPWPYRRSLRAQPISGPTRRRAPTLKLLRPRHRPTTRDPVAPHPTTIATITGITLLDFGVHSRITPPIRIGAVRGSLTTAVRIGVVHGGVVHGEATGAGGKRNPRARLM